MDKAIELTVRLIDARDTMRRLFGDDYARIVAPRVEALKEAARNQNQSALQVAVGAANRMEQASVDGMEILLLLAAAVEISEERVTEVNS